MKCLASFLGLLTLVAGCTGSSAIPSQAGDNPRNTLLKRIQGQDEDQAVQTLCQVILSDEEPALRRDAMRFVSSFGADSEKAVPTLVQVLRDAPDQRLQIDARQALQEIGAASVPVLLAELEPSTGGVRVRMIEALGRIGAPAAEAVPTLTDLLESEDNATRIAAADALGRIGPAAKNSLPALIRLLELPPVRLEGSQDGGRAYRASRDLRRAAVQAIEPIGPDPAALAVLRQALAEQPSIAESAARAVGQLGADAAPAVPELLAVLQRNDHGGKDLKTAMARRAALEALQQIGPAAADAAPLLRDLLQQGWQSASVAETLQQIEPPEPSGN